jgi:hypothetical protein
MITREDRLRMVFRNDSSTVIEFEDGTRITTFYAIETNDSESDGNFRNLITLLKNNKKQEIISLIYIKSSTKLNCFQRLRHEFSQGC